MSQLHSILSIISFLSVLPEILILAMSALYMSRTNRLEGKLLFTGSLIHLFVRVFYFIIPYIALMNYDDGGTDNMQTLYLIAGIASFAGSIIFCVGLVKLIQFALSKISQA
jgi:hypothetical protein